MAVKESAFRPSITADEIFALLDIMDSARRGDQLTGMNPVLADYYKKLRVKAFEIGEGIAKPAYVNTGKRKESAINLEALGSSEEEVAGIGKYNNSAHMDDATNAQLMWMVEHPEISMSNMPPIEEFMKDGKYYEEPASTEECAIPDTCASDTGGTGRMGYGRVSESGTEGTESAGSSSESTSDCFISVGDDTSNDSELAAALFRSL